MRKTLLALASAGVFALATTAPSPADARCRGCGVAAGVIGGIAAGAIIGSAIAGRPAHAHTAPVYEPVEGYEPYHSYRRRAPVECYGGYWARRPLFDRWGNVVGYSRPRFFCP